MLTLAVIAIIAFLAVFASVLALYLWWRLRRLDDSVYCIGWDLNSLLARLTKHEEQGE
jgi:hypothetical protein